MRVPTVYVVQYTLLTKVYLFPEGFRPYIQLLDLPIWSCTFGGLKAVKTINLSTT